MDPTALHLEIRNGLELSDELSRHEHALGNDELAAHLGALRTALDDLERMYGRSHDRAPREPASPVTADVIERAARFLRSRRDEVPRRLRARYALLVASAERIAFALVRPDARVPAKPLLRHLPLARVVPQDVHATLDWAGSLAMFVSARLARTSRAKVAGRTLALAGASVWAMSDHRPSAAKLVPIEVHEAIDYAWGLSAIAAPFVLGYAKKDPVAAAIQAITGATICVVSLLTDYRASKGVTVPIRSKGGPRLERDKEQELEAQRPRVPEAQRALEGLSSAPTDWEPDRTWPGRGGEP